jgi:ELMO domain-containing protein
VNFADVWFRVKNLKLIYEKNLVQKESQGTWSFLRKYVCSCFSKRLSVNLLTEQDQIIAFSKQIFKEEDDYHFRMLYTIYTTLTGDHHCARFGSHWEQVGYNSQDPARDLGKSGMFGILQIIAFTSFHRKFFIQAYRYSRDETHGFPFCNLLLKISKFTIKSLREGYLQSLVENQKSVINAVNNFYFSMFYKIFRYYQRNKFEHKDLKELRKKVGAELQKDPESAIRDFSQEVHKYINKSQVAKKLNFEERRNF